MDVAIIGIGLRFPGRANSPEELWQMLSTGESAWSTIPPERFGNGLSSTHETIFRPEGGHFLKQDLGVFDAGFFRITSEEAEAMDPQQRLLLEVSCEALENAGISLDSIAGSDAAVVIGKFLQDYDTVLSQNEVKRDRYSATGTGQAILANRLSYFFDLRGPSITIDTACSSSLVALHQARQSILTGEAEIAIVGGVNLMCHPNMTSFLDQLGVLSDDGRSYPFDARAQGYGRGEGCASLIMKRLDAAVRDSDPIRAVIRGSGLSSDGRTAGITFPSGDAQESLIRGVYQHAKLNPKDTVFVESHGTGTPTGDPIEARAIYKVFRENQPTPLPLYLGSIKGNIGHLEGASGLASLIKAVLSLEKGQIPPTANHKSPKANIPVNEWKMLIPTVMQEWPQHAAKRASVSSFGFGGTNAHVILEGGYDFSKQLPVASIRSHPRLCSIPHKFTDIDKWTFVLSSHDTVSGTNIIRKMADYVGSRRNEDKSFMHNLAFTLSEKRSLFSFRLAVSASTPAELHDILSRSHQNLRKQSNVPRVGFVFTGMGAQWAGMGLELLERYPLMQTAFTKADECLKALGCSWMPSHEIRRSATESRVNEPQVSQVLCAVLQMALTDVLASWNVYPVTVVGHSGGEIPAAYAAGALSFEAGLKVAYVRGKLTSLLADSKKGTGGMLVVALPEEDVKSYLTTIENGKASIACYNSPSNVTVSGDLTALQELEDILKPKGIFVRRLNVNLAYHSPQMYEIADECKVAIRDIQSAGDSNVRFFSSVEGTELSSGLLGPDYWVRNMTCPVRFSTALANMCLDSGAKGGNIDMLLEVGPHSTLAASIRQILGMLEADAPVTTPRIRYTPCLIRNTNAVATMHAVSGELFTAGCSIDISNVNSHPVSGKPKMLVDLPPYSWNHTFSYWCKSPVTRASGHQAALPGAHGSDISSQSQTAASREPNDLCDTTVSQMIESLNKAAEFFVQHALNSITPYDVSQMTSHHRRLLDMLRSVQGGTAMGSGLTTRIGEYKEEKEDIRESIAQCRPEGAMLSRIGENLLRIFRREIDPLSLMLEGDLLFDYYSSAFGVKHCHEKLAEIVKGLANQNNNLTILEVGAGTGASTLAVMSALGKNGSIKMSRYDFTDVSPGFFERARTLLEPWSRFMDYSIFDIEKSAWTQGFQPNTYDVILAFDVIHATRDIRQTLENFRGLLKPGGKLIFVELTNPPLRWSMIFGTLPGWWLGVESGRVSGSTLPESEWAKLLRDASFSGLDICFRDFPDPQEHVHSLMVSTAISNSPPTYPPCVIIRGPELSTDIFTPLTCSLKQRGFDDVRISDLGFDSSTLAGRICVFFSSPWDIVQHLGQEEIIHRLSKTLNTTKGLLLVTQNIHSPNDTPGACLTTEFAAYLRKYTHGNSIATLDIDVDDACVNRDISNAVCSVLESSFAVPNSRARHCEFQYKAGHIQTRPQASTFPPKEAATSGKLNDLKPSKPIAKCTTVNAGNKASTQDGLTQDEIYAVYDSMLDDISHYLTSLGCPLVVVDRVRKCLKGLTKGGRMMRCFMPLETGRRSLADPLSPVQARDLATLGWILEIAHVAILMDDDMMGSSIFRRRMPCRHLQPNVGLTAVADGRMLRSCSRYLLRIYFQDHPAYLHLLHLWDEMEFYTNLGQITDVHLAHTTFFGFRHFNRKTLDFLVSHKTAWYSFYLPVALASYYLQLPVTNDLTHVERIMVTLGKYFQAMDDYLDLFGDPAVLGNMGNDVYERKLSWPIVEALERFGNKERRLLEVVYSDGNVNQVKAVFQSLEIPRVYAEFTETSFKTISEMIDQIDEAQGLKRQLFHLYLSKIHQRNE